MGPAAKTGPYTCMHHFAVCHTNITLHFLKERPVPLHAEHANTPFPDCHTHVPTLLIKKAHAPSLQSKAMPPFLPATHPRPP